MNYLKMYFILSKEKSNFFFVTVISKPSVSSATPYIIKINISGLKLNWSCVGVCVCHTREITGFCCMVLMVKHEGKSFGKLIHRWNTIL